MATELFLDDGTQDAAEVQAALANRALAELSPAQIDGMGHDLARLIQETAENGAHAWAAVREEYGHIHRVGEGQAKFTKSPGASRIDYRAVTENHERILIETKNVESRQKKYRAQAEWYNAMAENAAPVLMYALDEGRAEASVSTHGDHSTLLFYPRLGEHERVDARFPYHPNMHREAWQAKQIGFSGGIPATDCASKCRCKSLQKRHGLELAETNEEVLPPLASLMAELLHEGGADYQTYALYQYAQRLLGDEFREWQYQVRRDSHRTTNGNVKVGVVAESIAAQLAVRLSIDAADAMKVLQSSGKIRVEADVIRTELDAIMTSWSPMIPEIHIPSVKRVATQTFAIPGMSERAIKDGLRGYRN